MFRITSRAAVRGAVIVVLLAPAIVPAQSRGTADSLVQRALGVNPRIRAAASHVDASRARVGPAGAWPDPMLMAGIQNLPLSREAAAGHAAPTGPEPMTMKMLGVSQMVPYPGKTSLRTRAARADAEIAEARLAIITRDVRREVMDAYLDLVAARLLLNILDRQQQVATSILPATEARYVAGTAAQSDVLKARTEATMLVQERNEATQEERSALARLAAVTDDADLSTVAADSFPAGFQATRTVPALESVETHALQTNPRLRERRAMLAMQSAQAHLAARDYLPDFDLSVQYGQRDRLPDMITAIVSVPLPVQRSRKQSATARAARFDVAAAEAELRSEENTVRSEVVRAYAAVQRQRANLDLLERAVLPQARATFASTSATYQSGRAELLDVLDAMRALFATETMYVRTLAEYGKSLSELEALVGAEVHP
ncbi:MAG: TolC family protein [Gemmatimonadaceae bacterium]